MMQFEKFRAIHDRTMYYVTDYAASKAKQAEAIAEVARITKTTKGRYQILTVWVGREPDGTGLLQLEPDKGYTKMMAVVRRWAACKI